MSFPRIVLVVVLTATSASTVLAEEVDHPLFLSWASRPVGTSVTLRTLTEAKGHVITTTNKSTLMKIKPDTVTLEFRRISDATGQKQEKAPESFEQRRKFPLFPGVKKTDIGKPMGTLKQGQETITLAGKEFKAVWFEGKTQGEGGLDWITRTWMSEEVPGRLLKSVIQIPEAGTTITTELVEFQVP